MTSYKSFMYWIISLLNLRQKVPVGTSIQFPSAEYISLTFEWYDQTLKYMQINRVEGIGYIAHMQLKKKFLSIWRRISVFVKVSKTSVKVIIVSNRNKLMRILYFVNIFGKLFYDTVYKCNIYTIKQPYQEVSMNLRKILN